MDDTTELLPRRRRPTIGGWALLAAVVAGAALAPALWPDPPAPRVSVDMASSGPSAEPPSPSTEPATDAAEAPTAAPEVAVPVASATVDERLADHEARLDVLETAPTPDPGPAAVAPVVAEPEPVVDPEPVAAEPTTTTSTTVPAATPTTTTTSRRPVIPPREWVELATCTMTAATTRCPDDFEVTVRGQVRVTYETTGAAYMYIVPADVNPNDYWKGKKVVDAGASKTISGPTVDPGRYYMFIGAHGTITVTLHQLLEIAP